MKKTLQVFGAMAALAALCSGCAFFLVGGAAAGAGTMAYLRGELRTEEAASLPTTYAAAEQALADLQIALRTKGKDALTAKVEGEGFDERPVVIKLKRVDPNHTETNIRVGTFGDEKLSRVILDQMRKHY